MPAYNVSNKRACLTTTVSFLPVLHDFGFGNLLPELGELRGTGPGALLHLGGHDQEAVLG